MVLWIPREDGSYQSWSASSDEYTSSRLAQDKRVVTVIDPPDRGLYSADAECQIISYASNDRSHFLNWDKDGVLLVT